MMKLIGAMLGGSLGYLYYKKVGCAGGTCPLTANPWITIIYGAIMGVLISDMM